MSPLFFDTHVHLPDHEIDWNEYYSRSLRSGVPWLLFCGSGMDQCERIASLSDSEPRVFFAAGTHPHECAQSGFDQPAEAFRVFSSHPRHVAVGEIGLDFYYGFSPEDRQIASFSDYLNLALSLDKPAIVHLRDKDGVSRAYDAAFELLAPFARQGGRFALHAFAGSVEQMEKFAELGAWFGVGGMVTFRRADNIRLLAVRYPDDRFLLETDSPYLAPVPHRGEENHPALLPCSASALAALRGVPLERLAEQALLNSKRLFRVELS